MRSVCSVLEPSATASTRSLNTSPWLTFAGLAFGIVSAVLMVVAQMRKFL